jgi:hypothetical protein
MVDQIFPCNEDMTKSTPKASTKRSGASIFSCAPHLYRPAFIMLKPRPVEDFGALAARGFLILQPYLQKGSDTPCT